MKCKHLLIDGCIHGGRNLWEEMLSNYHVSISYNQMPLFLLQCTFRNEKTRRVRDEKVECQGSGELRCKTGGQLVGTLNHAYKLQFSISTRWFTWRELKRFCSARAKKHGEGPEIVEICLTLFEHIQMVPNYPGWCKWVPWVLDWKYQVITN